jgi:hypothetical protein
MFGRVDTRRKAAAWNLATIPGYRVGMGYFDGAFSICETGCQSRMRGIRCPPNPVSGISTELIGPDLVSKPDLRTFSRPFSARSGPTRKIE